MTSAPKISYYRLSKPTNPRGQLPLGSRIRGAVPQRKVL